MSIARRARRGLAAAAAAGVIAPALAVIAIAAPAQAADPITTTTAQFRWGLNNESNNAAFQPGAYNFFSAGVIGNPGKSQALNGADSGATWADGTAAGWTAADGNVVIEKKGADGQYAPTTWAGTKTAPDGSAVTVAGSTFTDHQVVINQGTGTLDAAADDADITWDGDFTALYYSGLTYFTVSDPHLLVDNGVGSVTATVNGYETDRVLGGWTALPSTTVTLATLTGVDVTTDGLLTTPSYVDVAYTAPNGGTAQAAKTVDNAAYWGSFPSSFVDFQQKTGTSSYWYTSGTGDSRKTPLPIEVASSVPSVEVDTTTLAADGTTTVTVRGKGFLPARATGVRAPLKDTDAGTYVVFGKFAQNWRPSALAASSSRVYDAMNWAVPAASMASIGGSAGGAVELSPDGSFTANLTVNKAALDTKVAASAVAASLVNYGIYTYAGSGASQAAYETYTPVTFPSVAVSKTTVSANGSTLVTVTGTGFAPSAATGVRPPLAGKDAGAYVVFGKFAQNWRPSALAASSSRVYDAMNWAVPAASMASIGGSAGGAVELSADGSFTASLAVSKAALDTKVAASAAAETLVNYGIYTYAGSGAAQAGYETYTPMSFVTITGATPTISGTAKVGSTLSARAGAWAPVGTTLAYQWKANGKAIAGATKPALVLSAAHAGAKITVSVTGTLTGVTETTTSNAVTVAKGTLSVTKLKVSGKAKVGKKLTASLSVSAGSRVAYQWTANGKAIKGAKAKNLTLKKAHKGKRIAVKVTVTKSGYTTVTKTSSKTAKVKR